MILTRAGVPKLGCMYSQGYICLSEGVHLAIEGKIMSEDCYFELFINISVNIIIIIHSLQTRGPYHRHNQTMQEHEK